MNEELKQCPFCGDEAVQKDMDTPFKNGWIGCPKCRCFIDWIKNGKPQAITAWNTRDDGWISVDERLPTDDEMVLCVSPLGTIVTAFNSSNSLWHYVASGMPIKFDVTHWQPLPTAPKGE